MRVCIENGLIIDPVAQVMTQGSIFAEDGIIACVGMGGADDRPDWANEPDVLRIDGTNKWVTPGLIDLHVHLREPGFEYKEDIQSGSQAAIGGGFKAICCMPNTNPVLDNVATLNFVAEKARHVPGITVLPIGAITKGQLGRELADLEAMAAWGIRAISEDGKSVMDASVQRQAMQKAAKLGLCVFSHAEDETLAGLPIGEELIIARDILLAQETGCRLHICHVSTKGAVALIRRAKSDGISVTAETAPHYFTLNAAQVQGNPNRKMNPPLRKASDILAIQEALRDGTIDAIATDHAPHAKAEKAVPFDQAPNGVIGLETSFAVSYTALVKTGLLTPLQLIDRMSFGPARILGMEGGKICRGAKADLTLIDVEAAYEVRGDGFVSKSENSPFLGMHVFGKPVLLSQICRAYCEDKSSRKCVTTLKRSSQKAER